MATMTFNKVDRHRRRYESPKHTETEVEGQAHLCFTEDGSYFQGVLETADHTTFGLNGHRISKDYDADKNSPDGIPVEYDVTLADLETGSAYSLKKVSGRNGQLCTFHCQKVSFETKDVYRGIKAQMMIQKFLGSKSVGENCHVFAGPMKVSFSELPVTGQAWSL